MKYILLIISTLLSTSLFSQTKVVNQDRLVRAQDGLKIKEGNQLFNLDTKTVTITLVANGTIDAEYRVKRQNKLGFIDLGVPEGTDFEAFIQKLESDASIKTIEYNNIGTYFDLMPNDPSIGSQWHHGVIKAYDAWDQTTGIASAIIAVLDSGTEWDHEDLGLGSDAFQNIALNSGEDAWSDPNDPSTGNGIDDDGNGLIDDWKGWDFDSNDNDARTTNFHGTFVAGVTNAKTNNGVGVAGVAGGNNSTGSTVLPYCVGVSGPNGSILDDAIIAAVDNGASVIQLSLSVGQTTAIDNALAYAKTNHVPVVCSSGNGSAAFVGYPARDPNVYSVGATNQSNQRASFSNYGDDLDIVAPGVDIFSTSINNAYGTSSGTSFSSPQVSAVIALLYSIDPTLTFDEVIEILSTTAQRIGGYTYSITPGKPHGPWNMEMGYGVLDALAAVNALCTSMTTLKDETVDANRVVDDCNVYIDNVQITNNSKLTINAARNVEVYPETDVHAGSELEINK